MKIITLHVSNIQYKWLKENSYKGLKINKKENDLTFSEHIRKALDEYIEKEGSK